MNLETIGLAAVCALPATLFLTGGQQSTAPPTKPPTEHNDSQVEGLREDLAELERRIAEARAEREVERLERLAEQGLVSRTELVEAQRALERSVAARQGRDLRPLEFEWAAADLQRVHAMAIEGLVPKQAVTEAEQALVEARAAVERMTIATLEREQQQPGVEVRVLSMGQAEGGAIADGTVEGLRLFVLGEDGELRELDAGGGKFLEGTPFEVEIELEVDGQRAGDGHAVQSVDVDRPGSGSAREVIVERYVFPSTGERPADAEAPRGIRFEPHMIEGPGGSRRVLEIRRAPDGSFEAVERPTHRAPQPPDAPGSERSVRVFEFQGRGGPDAGPRSWQVQSDGVRLFFENARIEGERIGNGPSKGFAPNAPPDGEGRSDVDAAFEQRAPAPQVWFVDRDGNEFRGPGARPPFSKERSDRVADDSDVNAEFAGLLRELNAELRAVREELAALRHSMANR